MADIVSTFDGSTDNTTDINNALAAGGEVTFPADATIARITRNLNLTQANTNFWAKNPAFQIRPDNGLLATTAYPNHTAVISTVGVGGCHIHDIGVDMVTNNVTMNVVGLYPTDGQLATGTASQDCHVYNMRILGADFHNYMIWSRRAIGSRIYNNDIDGGVTTYNGSSQQEGIEMAGGSDVKIWGNSVKNIGNAGILIAALSGQANHSNSNVFIHDNIVTACRNNIEIQANHDGTNLNGLYSCFVYHNQSLAPWTTGIMIRATHTGIAGNPLIFTDVKVDSNFVHCSEISQQPNSINWNPTQTDNDMHGCTMNHNNIIGGRKGIENFRILNMHNFRMFGNVIRDSDEGAHAYLFQGCTNGIFSRNIVEGCWFAPFRFTTCDNIQVTDNIGNQYDQSGTGQALVSESSNTNMTVTGNTGTDAT